MSVRVVRHVDHRLLCAASQGRLVLHPQHRNFLSALILLASRVHHARLHCSREPLIAILTRQLEPHTLASLVKFSLLPARHDLLLHAHRRRTLPHAFAPALRPAVQVVGPIVGGELVGLVVERINLGIGEAVRNTTDRGTKVCAVVGFVVGLRSKALHNVVPCDGERLEDRAQGEEGDLVGGHGDVYGLDSRWGWKEFIT